MSLAFTLFKCKLEHKIGLPRTIRGIYSVWFALLPKCDSVQKDGLISCSWHWNQFYEHLSEKKLIKCLLPGDWFTVCWKQLMGSSLTFDKRNTLLNQGNFYEYPISNYCANFLQANGQTDKQKLKDTLNVERTRSIHTPCLLTLSSMWEFVFSSSLMVCV